MLCIKNGTIFTITNENAVKKDIYVENGKIVQIGNDLDIKADTVYDANGLFVFPGLVDCHSHLGLAGYAIRFEGSDYNEYTDSLTPHLDALDGINPFDESLKNAYLGGVTTVGSGPGSSNVIGGKFVAYKTYGRRIEDMIVRKDVAMKCAFGENPKFCYKDKDNSSRMSTAAKFRDILNKTIEYLEKLELAKNDISKKPAYNAKLEALIPVIRGQMPLKAHAHRADDIFTAIRICKEFNLKLTLEHVTEGHLIADYLAKENIPLAIGPSLTNASKVELKNRTFKTPAILNNAGCRVSIITDAPVIPQEYLALCATLAVKSGMDKFEALKAITINPAIHLGIEDRVGSLEVGKDADFVIMDGCILESSSNVIDTIINGVVLPK